MSFIETYTKVGIQGYLHLLKDDLVTSGASGAANIIGIRYDMTDQVRVKTDQQMSAGEIAAVGTEITNWVVPTADEESKAITSTSRVTSIPLVSEAKTYREHIGDNWEEVASMPYAGTDWVGQMKRVTANLWNSTGSTSQLRLVDLSNSGNVICSVSTTSNSDNNMVTTDTIANLPANECKISIQLKETGNGKCRCGGLNVFIQ